MAPPERPSRPARVHPCSGMGCGGTDDGESPALSWVRVTSGRERGRTLCRAREGSRAAAERARASERASERAISVGRVGRRAPPSGVGRFVQRSWSSVADKEGEVAFVRRKE